MPGRHNQTVPAASVRGTDPGAGTAVVVVLDVAVVVVALFELRAVFAPEHAAAHNATAASTSTARRLVVISPPIVGVRAPERARAPAPRVPVGAPSYPPMLPRRSLGGPLEMRGRRTGDRAAIHCTNHVPGLAAYVRFVSDARPSGDGAAVSAIASGDCPACRPRYLRGFAEVAEPRFAPLTDLGLPVGCDCCGTRWQIVDTPATGGSERSWEAVVGAHLQIIGEPKPIPAGETIDASWFTVDAVDLGKGLVAAVRREIATFDAASERPAADDLVEDLTESLLAIARKKADEDGELGRIMLEHGLGRDEAARWRSEAERVLALLRALQAPAEARTRTCPRCARPGDGPRVSRERFEQLVAEALDSIPPELARRMENVAVVVEDESRSYPEPSHLFGLYSGVALTRRRHYVGTVPDRITIYQEPITRHCRTEQEIAEQVRRTVIHEVAHHFGIGDPELRALGW